MSFSLPIPGWAYALLAVGCLGGAVALTLRSSQFSSRKTRLVALGLRIAVLLSLLFILADPTRRKSAESEGISRVPVLLDVSESMALGKPKRRLEAAQAVIDALPAEHVRVYAFDDVVRSLSKEEVSQLGHPVGVETRLGAAVGRGLEAARALRSRRMLVLSDGRAHDPQALAESALAACRQEIKIDVFPLGGKEVVPNAAIRNCQVERHAPAESHVPVRARLSLVGMSGRTMTMRIRDAEGQILSESSFVAADGVVEKDTGVTVGREDGDYTLELDAGEERFLGDNRFAFRIRVADPKIRVLYMEGSNHKDKVWTDVWEYDFIGGALRETANIEVDIFTVDKQEEEGGKLFKIADQAQGYPTTREDLYKYDVIICSDVNRFIFTQEQLEWTSELVAEQGGGFCMIGGYTAFGAGGWDRTAWERMIPLDMQTKDEGYVWETFQPVIPESARAHPLWFLSDDPAEQKRILDKHPELMGTNLVNCAKPAATVLATYEKRSMPIIAVQPYGRGRSMAFTSDAAGGWGEKYQTEWGEGDGERDNRHYRRFWVNAIRWLAENSLAEHRTPLLASTSAVSCRPGERVTVRVRRWKLDEASRLRGMEVTASVSGALQSTRPLQLNPAEGAFVGTVEIPRSLKGNDAEILIKAVGADGKSAGEDRVYVRLSRLSLELSEPAADHDTLRELADLTGGRVVTDVSDAIELVEKGCLAKEEAARQYTVPVWDRWWAWLALTLLLALEGFHRRACRLGWL